jgi:hypothetical protein
MIELMAFCKVPGSDPQRFLVVEKDLEKAERSRGYQGRMSFPTEQELRAALKDRVTDDEIDSWISSAPDCPVPEGPASLTFEGMPKPY